MRDAAAVAWGPGEPLAMEEVEVAPPGRLEVRVKLLFTSICHTDLSFLKGEVLTSDDCLVSLLQLSVT
jgi:Zn-dependent alcohol dehydrogenase